MRYNALLLLIFATCSLLINCGTKKSTEHAETIEGNSKPENSHWQAMNDFHSVMAETFHPYKDSSNLEPARKHYGDLQVAAQRWIDSPIPLTLNHDSVTLKLQQLQADTNILAEKVNGGSDAEIADALTSIHNKFHMIQETCSDGGQHHEHQY